MIKEKPPVLTDDEANEALENGVNFDHKPSSLEEVHRQIQRDADVRFWEDNHD